MTNYCLNHRTIHAACHNVLILSTTTQRPRTLNIPLSSAACLPAGWMDEWCPVMTAYRLDSLQLIQLSLRHFGAVRLSLPPVGGGGDTDSHFFHSGSICLSERRRLRADHRAYRPDDHDDNRWRSSTSFTLILTLLKIKMPSQCVFVCVWNPVLV